jgi:hypothetical protein
VIGQIGHPACHDDNVIIDTVREVKLIQQQ